MPGKAYRALTLGELDDFLRRLFILTLWLSSLQRKTYLPGCGQPL